MLREYCYDGLRAGVRGGIIGIGVGAASVTEIDRINVLRANLLAMRRAVAALEAWTGNRPDLALVDGNVAPALPCAVRTIVKGDSLSLSIAAASVVAKVTRDRIMHALGAALSRIWLGYQCRISDRGACRGNPQARRDAAPSPLVRADSRWRFRRPRICWRCSKPALSRPWRTARLRQRARIDAAANPAHSLPIGKSACIRPLRGR